MKQICKAFVSLVFLISCSNASSTDLMHSQYKGMFYAYKGSEGNFALKDRLVTVFKFEDVIKVTIKNQENTIIHNDTYTFDSNGIDNSNIAYKIYSSSGKKSVGIFSDGRLVRMTANKVFYYEAIKDK